MPIQTIIRCLIIMCMFPHAATAQHTSNRMISKEDAITIATERAVTDKNGMFSTPYLESVTFREDNSTWVVKLLSENPDSGFKCIMYMWVTIDATNAAITAVDSGGGA